MKITSEEASFLKDMLWLHILEWRQYLDKHPKTEDRNEVVWQINISRMLLDKIEKAFHPDLVVVRKEPGEIKGKYKSAIKERRSARHNNRRS